MADQNRIEGVRRRMTPKVMEAIEAQRAAGTLPRAILEGLSKGAFDAVHAGGAPLESVMPVAALEAIVQRTGRPPLLIRNDKIVLELLPDFAPDTAGKIKNVEPWVKSVGRVEFVNASMAWGGTGWVIQADGNARIIATNRHVGKIVAKRRADGTAVFMRSAAGIRYGANVDFGEEDGSNIDDTSRTAPVTSIKYLADDLAADVALLRIESTGFALPTPFDLADTPAALRDLVALIGYPAFDPRNDASDQARYFNDLYEVKRFAPGFVIQALTGSSTLSHDCTSLGGNSGSPLISLDTGKVVGLHFAGVYGKENSAVGVDTLKALLAGKIIQVPGMEGVESPADGRHPAEFFAGRSGFATKFLHGGKVATPWPKLGITTGLAEPSDHPPEAHELRYTNFGVKYSTAEKLPLMTAVNIDGAHTVRIKRANDKWFIDGRIDPATQLGSKNYVDAEMDRGHMVRREDPNWGPHAEVANFDTFHYVNAAPQHSKLNQGKQLWQGLENYILDNARTAGFQACVFTGPVLGDDDPMIDDARVPMEYWKLVATLDADGSKLRATAYLLSQGQLIRDLLEKRAKTEAMEGVVLGEYRTFQISVADLALATGHDFSAYLAADPLARKDPATEAAADSEPRYLPLDDVTDMVL